MRWAVGLAGMIGAKNGAEPLLSRLSRCFFLVGPAEGRVSLGTPPPRPSPLTPLQESGQGESVGEGGFLNVERKFNDLFSCLPQHLGPQLYVPPVVSMECGG